MLSPSDNLGSAKHTHSVVFYRSDSFIIQSAVSFLLTGLFRGDSILIVAVKEHRKKIEFQLKIIAAKVGIPIRKDQIVTLDTHETLSTFMENDNISINKFTTNLEFPIKEILNHYPGVTMYGDMVNVLCEKNNFWGAMKIEKLGCELAEKYQRLNFHCGYCVTNFNKKNDYIELAEICQQHTDIETQPHLVIPQNSNVRNKIITVEERFDLDKESQSMMLELKLFLNETKMLQEEISILDREVLHLHKRLESTINPDRGTLEKYNMLHSMETPILYLDAQLQIYWYNARLFEILPLIKLDIGRSIFKFNLHFDAHDLLAHIKEVLAERKSKALRALHNNGNYYIISMLPITQSLTSPNGVVIFFINVDF